MTNLMNMNQYLNSFQKEERSTQTIMKSCFFVLLMVGLVVTLASTASAQNSTLSDSWSSSSNLTNGYGVGAGGSFTAGGGGSNGTFQPFAESQFGATPGESGWVFGASGATRGWSRISSAGSYGGATADTYDIANGDVITAVDVSQNLTIDATTGAITPGTYQIDISAWLVDPAKTNTVELRLFDRDGAGGALTPITSVGPYSAGSSDRDNPTTIYSDQFDITSGTWLRLISGPDSSGTSLPGGEFNFVGINVTMELIPEPSTLVFLLLGSVSLVFMRWRPGRSRVRPTS